MSTTGRARWKVGVGAEVKTRMSGFRMGQEFDWKRVGAEVEMSDGGTDTGGGGVETSWEEGGGAGRRAVLE